MQRAQQVMQERAAIHKDIWLLEQVPVTAVGKIVKPQLRRGAMCRILTEPVADLAQELYLEVSPDSTLARINLQ